MKIEVNRPAPVEIAAEKSPSALSIMWRELVRDRLALVSLIILSVILLIVYGVSIFLDQEEIVKGRLFGHSFAAIGGALAWH
ncbi:hypothetical protein LR69_02180 [Geobacillus sp. BCO2]|nr:hypothetical protein LR69_02180 [Geobacillus sp. BCO2]